MCTIFFTHCHLGTLLARSQVAAARCERRRERRDAGDARGVITTRNTHVWEDSSRLYSAAVGIRRHGRTGVLLRHRGPRASSGRTARRLRPTAIHALECRGRIYNTSHLHRRSGQPVPTALCTSAAPRTGHLGTWRADALMQWQWHTIRQASSQIA